MKFIKTFCIIIALILALGCVTVGADGYSVPEPLLYGDVDMDGEVTIKDATAIQKGIAELEYLTSVQRFIADPNKTGVSIKNATDIQKKLAGIFADDSLVGFAVSMELQNQFSSKMSFVENHTEIDRILVYPSNIEWEYTLADFPEYDFNSIEIEYVDLEYSSDYLVCYLYLSNPSKESVEEAICALDYRANLDLSGVYACTFDYIDD